MDYSSLALELPLSPRERGDAPAGGPAYAAFAAGRTLAKLMASRLTGIEPGLASLARGSGGAPEWESPVGAYASVSHSRGLAACAIAAFPVGVDLERIDRRRDVAGIALAAFAPGESAASGDCPGELELFYARWTLKEAWLKATGESLWSMRSAPSFYPLGQGGVLGVEPCEAARGVSFGLAEVEGPDGLRWSLAVASRSGGPVRYLDLTPFPAPGPRFSPPRPVSPLPQPPGR